jgi:F0F1-type ATP synthase assembly protein I
VRDQLEQAAKKAHASAKIRDDGLSQAFEFAAGPVVMGLIGWLVDLVAGTGPLFLVAFAVFGVIGSFVSFYYRYQAQTARLDEGKPWTRRTH